MDKTFVIAHKTSGVRSRSKAPDSPVSRVMKTVCEAGHLVVQSDGLCLSQ
jgi:hypothetical protein